MAEMIFVMILFQKFRAPEVDAQLEYVQGLKDPLADGTLYGSACLPLIISIPEPAEELSKNRRANQKRHQKPQVDEVPFAVEVHHCPYVQPYVRQEENQPQKCESKVQEWVLQGDFALHGICWFVLKNVSETLNRPIREFILFELRSFKVLRSAVVVVLSNLVMTDKLNEMFTSRALLVFL